MLNPNDLGPELLQTVYGRTSAIHNPQYVNNLTVYVK